MKYNFIKTSIDQHIFKLTLARPEKRNAFTPTMVNEISHAIEEANKDKTVRLVMINAEGPVFCAGMDMKTFENPALDILNTEIQNQHISLASAISQLNKPSIAIVEGDVLAGGFLIVLECTLTEKERLPYLLQALEDLKKTKDAKEGMAAFFDKRVPNWTNE